jgi:hypothetical protein
MSIFGITDDRLLACAVAFFFSAAVLPAAHADALGNASQFPAETQVRQASLTAVSAPASQNLFEDKNQDDITHHLRDSLSPEAFDSFRLFVYVNKAGIGPHAQRMYVLEKTGAGNLAVIYDWPVSTGRETVETDAHGHLQSTATPQGFYQLDADRLYEQHVSGQWDEPMPYAMFFNWVRNGRKTGLAIHGTGEQETQQLGMPASAGCIRLSEDNARTLFNLVRAEFHSSSVPQLAYLNGDTSVSSAGSLLHDPQGQLKLVDGYSVLVAVDDYDGGSRTTALR